MRQNNTEKRQNVRQVQGNTGRGFANRHGGGSRFSWGRGFSYFPQQYQGEPYMGQITIVGTDPSVFPNPFMTEQRITPEQELELLRQQAQYIESNLQRIQQRINELSQGAD